MRAIVTGVSGQDGYYMSELLLGLGHHVLGLTTNLSGARAALRPLQSTSLNLAEFDYRALGGITDVINSFRPDMIFNLAAKATGQGMFDEPQVMSRLNGSFALDILEAIRGSADRREIVFCQASSSEMFGNVENCPQSELTPFYPKSPYGAAKLYAHHMINIYRSAYAIRACSAILYNHESVRRSTHFVTKKIANGAARIKLGLDRQLELAGLDSLRDWGYAPEYMQAMYLMATAPEPTDYVVATGKLNSVRRLCELAFGCVDLDYRQYIKVNSQAQRITHSVNLQGNPAKIREMLGWSATRSVEQIMPELVAHELQLLQSVE
jgi:GDPmannose 4,6-dehydratase